MPGRAEPGKPLIVQKPSLEYGFAIRERPTSPYGPSPKTQTHIASQHFIIFAELPFPTAIVCKKWNFYLSPLNSLETKFMQNFALYNRLLNNHKTFKI